MRAKRIHRNVVDRARGFETNDALRIVEESGDARIAQLAHRKTRSHTNRRRRIRSEFTESRTIIHPRQRLYASMTKEGIAIGVLRNHRNDKRSLVACAHATECHRGERADARVVVGAEVRECVGCGDRARFTKHARGLCANLRITIIKRGQYEFPRLHGSRE